MPFDTTKAAGSVKLAIKREFPKESYHSIGSGAINGYLPYAAVRSSPIPSVTADAARATIPT